MSSIDFRFTFSNFFLTLFFLFLEYFFFSFFYSTANSRDNKGCCRPLNWFQGLREFGEVIGGKLQKCDVASLGT